MSNPAAATVPATVSEAELVARLAAARTSMLAEIHKVIIGQENTLEQLLLALLCRGHCLLEGVPGLAKTVMIQTLGRVLDLSFSRIQFTPDLMPSDITGTDIIQEDPQTHRRQFEFLQGPLFAHLVLGDEINRTPPKTQAALLEAMSERRVTCRGRTYELPDPFFVLATQNPIEQEGTYPLPEAQLDRFMFMIGVDYPSRAEELAIARNTTGGDLPTLEPVLSGEQVIAFQKLVRRVPVPDHLYEFAVDLTRRTRPGNGDSPAWVKPLVSWGAGPRAVQYLILGAKARAALQGSYIVRMEDIVAVADPVLRHRVMTTFTAESEGVTSRDVAKRLVEELGKAA